MVNYVYLGYGITDSNGVAKLDHDANGNVLSHSYTGVGAGELDIVASLDAPEDMGTESLQSQVYQLFDCYKYDSGMSDYNDIWTQSSQNVLIRESSGEYSTIKETTIGTTAFITITNIPLTDYRIEVDVFQVDGTQNEWFLTVLKQNYSDISSANSKLGEWKHISLDLTGIEANSRIRLNTGGTATEMRFKNFRVYPI